MSCKTVAEGKIFYTHGSYTIMASNLDANTCEQAIKALKGIITLKRKPPNF